MGKLTSPVLRGRGQRQRSPATRLDDLEAARTWRANHGGWIFVGEAGRCTWFDLKHTPSVIFTHAAVRGQGGKLV